MKERIQNPIPTPAPDKVSIHESSGGCPRYHLYVVSTSSTLQPPHKLRHAQRKLPQSSSAPLLK